MFESLKKFEEQHTQKPKDDAAKSRVNLEAFPKKVELGSGIIGSSHIHHVITPKFSKSHSGAAHMSLRLEGLLGGSTTDFEMVDSTERLVRSDQVISPLQVRFKPSSVGTQGADLVCMVRSAEDGVQEKRTVTVTATGVDPRAMPANRQEPPTKTEAEPVVDVKGIDPDLKQALSNKSDEAKRAAATLTERQRLGIRLVEKEVMSYQQAVPKGPWWSDLAMLAITMGSAGIGGAVAAALAPKLGPVIASMGAQKIASVVGDASIVAGITESLQAGLAVAFKPAEEALKPADPAQPKIKQDNEERVSSDGRFNFFTLQESALLTRGQLNANAVARQETKLQPILRTNSSAALAAMDSILAAIKAANNEVKPVNEQAFATTQQWTSGIARGVAGEESVVDPKSGRQHKTTDFTKGYGTATEQRYARGLLRVALNLATADARDAKFKVTSAAIDGVPRGIADRLRKTTLEEAAIPVRIVVTSTLGTAWITRDEAGRVMVTGKLPVFGDSMTQANMHAGATSICERLFSKTLLDWGVKDLNHDDEA